MASSLAPDQRRSYESTGPPQMCSVPSNRETFVVFGNAMQGVAPFCASHPGAVILVSVSEDTIAEVPQILRKNVPPTWQGNLILQVAKSVRPISRTMLRAKLTWRFLNMACKWRITDSAD